MGFFKDYFRAARSPSLDAIRPDLWAPDDPLEHTDQDPSDRAALLEQYKLYVEMADRISARRGLVAILLA